MAVLAALTVVALIAVLAVRASEGSPQGQDERGRSPAAVPLTPGSVVDRFFAHFVTSSGRVVRLDQGGDTVSEGQAYAMLMAAATGQRARFMSVWAWTRDHLLRPDHLLAWHWAAGRVVGRAPAADADIGTAAALFMAARRFADPALATPARMIADAAAARETGPTGGGPTLLAGPWAATPTEYVDPSYLSPPELSVLARSLGGVWSQVGATADAELRALTRNGHLPSDWAAIGSDHRIHPASPPGRAGAPARFGYDAVRVPIWMAMSCSAAVRQAAAGLLPALQRGHGRVGLDLSGRPAAGSTTDAVGLLAVGAAEAAAGHPRSARADLERAAQADQSHPQYYATAWIALATVGSDGLLETC